MERLFLWLEWVNSVFLSGLAMILLLGCGIWLTLRLGFFQLTGVGFIWKNTVATLLKKEKTRENGRGISSFQAMTTALAGTMGVGNIAGVATALVAGGPGSVFWMWVGAFFGMLTKYAEIFLAVHFRRTDRDGHYYGGPMYYMRDGLGWHRTAGVFALLCALCSLGIGNMTQVNSVSTAVQSAFGVPAWLSGLLVTGVVALVVLGGVKRIARVTELVIPFISIVYVCGAGAFLWIHREFVVDALRLIVTSALSLRTAAGGALGFGVSQAMRMGLSRGVFTNEAGLGSAPIAHAAADCKSPRHQGVWGILEVFLDTIVVCTITALVLLCADGGRLWQNSGLDGAALTTAAFETVFGRAGAQFLAVSIVFFAVSAMLGWCYYGERAAGYLSGDRGWAVGLYRLVFLLCIVPGATGSLTHVWTLSDCLNALMALPNLAALVALRGLVTAREESAPKRRRPAPASARGSSA